MELARAQFWGLSWHDGKASRDLAPTLYRLNWRKQLTNNKEDLQNEGERGGLTPVYKQQSWMLWILCRGEPKYTVCNCVTVREHEKRIEVVVDNRRLLIFFDANRRLLILYICMPGLLHVDLLATHLAFLVGLAFKDTFLYIRKWGAHSIFWCLYVKMCKYESIVAFCHILEWHS